MAPAASGSLADAKRQVTIDRILAAARDLMLGRAGLDVTMDDIAEAAGVGRRTLFRHFETRERLLAQALESGIQQYGDHLPAFEGDWHQWLRATCRAAHEMQAGYGPGYWELVSRVDLAPEIAAVETDRRRRRRKAMERIADQAWTAAGGSGTAPTSVRATATSHLSARFTAAVIEDAGQSWTVAADQAEAAITGAIAAALAATEPSSLTSRQGAAEGS